MHIRRNIVKRIIGGTMAFFLAAGAAAVPSFASETYRDPNDFTVLTWYPSQAFYITDKDSEGSPAEPDEDFAAYSDKYMESEYYERLKEVELTGDLRKDIIAMAKSQIGYHEGNGESGLDGYSEGTGDYTEYGRYMGTQGSAWCSEFVSWCARQANVPQDIFGNVTSASPSQFNAKSYAWDDTVYAEGEYIPKPGDLVLFNWDGKAKYADPASHTALIYKVSEEDEGLILTVIHGNSGNSVKKSKILIENTDTGRMYKGYAAIFIAVDYESASQSDH